MFSKIIKKLKGFHKKEQVNNEWNEEKLVKLIPVANEMEKIITECNFPYSINENWEEVAKAAKEPTAKIIQLFLDNNLLLDDIKFVSRLINTKYDRINQSINDSVNYMDEYIQTKIYGCPKRELDFVTLDNIMRTLVEEDVKNGDLKLGDPLNK